MILYVATHTQEKSPASLTKRQAMARSFMTTNRMLNISHKPTHLLRQCDYSLSGSPGHRGTYEYMKNEGLLEIGKLLIVF
jgi:hypothetical protein